MRPYNQLLHQCGVLRKESRGLLWYMWFKSKSQKTRFGSMSQPTCNAVMPPQGGLKLGSLKQQWACTGRSDYIPQFTDSSPFPVRRGQYHRTGWVAMLLCGDGSTWQRWAWTSLSPRVSPWLRWRRARIAKDKSYIWGPKITQHRVSHMMGGSPSYRKWKEWPQSTDHAKVRSRQMWEVRADQKIIATGSFSIYGFLYKWKKRKRNAYTFNIYIKSRAYIYAYICVGDMNKINQEKC